MFDLKLKNITSRTSNYLLKKGEELFNNGFIECVYYDYKIILYDEERIVTYSFFLRNAYYKQAFVSISVNEEDEITGYSSIYSHPENVFNSYSIACIMLYEYLDKQNRNNTMEYNIQKEKIVKEFVSLEEKTLKQEYEKRRKENIRNINSFLNELKDNDVLPLKNKVHVEPLLELGIDDVKLRLKIGIDKMYVVQNMGKFYSAVDDSDDATYGKNFTFNHSIENFDEEGVKIIDFVRKVDYSGTYSNSPFQYLERSDIDGFFELEKGKVINITRDLYGMQVFNSVKKYNEKIKSLEFKNQPFLISLEEYKLGITLNNKYMLKLDDDEDLIIYGLKHDYILKNNNCYIIKYHNKNERVLVRRLYENNGQSFKYIEDVFREDIYPRFNRIIKVDDEIVKPLELKDFKIESYFDYSDETIILKTKYLVNNEEVFDDLENTFGFNYKKYNNYIESLGFINNKLSDMKLIIRFLHTDLSDLKDISDVYLSDNIKALKVKRATKAQAHISYNTGMIQIWFEGSEFNDDELAKIIKSLRKGVKYVKLNKDTIIELDDDYANRLLNTVNEFNLDASKLTKEQTVPLYQSLKLMDNDLGIVDYKINDDLKKLLGEIAGYKKAKFDYPKELESVARPYQKEAFLWMKTLVKNNFCGILADDMGLGKTFEIISLLLTDNSNKPSLIVCPKSLCYNWKNEFEMWGKTITVKNVIGLSPERKEIIDNIKNDERVVYISSYDSLRNDIEYYKEKTFRYCILDEAQSIKNHETKKSQSVRLINSELRFVLTGTPIENTIIDLWSIFDFLMPNYLGKYTEFKGEYEKGVVLNNDKALVSRLVKKITPFVLRRTKEKVLKELPSKVEFIRIASMEKDQKKMYAAELKRTRDLLRTKDKGKVSILAAITRLREICVDPSMYASNYEGSSCKLDLLKEIVSEYVGEGHKIVIFSQFVSVFPKIKNILKELNIGYFILTGQTEAYKRVEMANEFNGESKEKVFLVSLKAGGTGLNLVGADVVIHLDPWWNYAVEEQATDRTHRIGQTRSVNVIKMIVEDSIEQKVIELQKIKNDLAQKIIQNDTDNIEKLSVDDISFLLT